MYHINTRRDVKRDKLMFQNVLRKNIKQKSLDFQQIHLQAVIIFI